MLHNLLTFTFKKNPLSNVSVCHCFILYLEVMGFWHHQKSCFFTHLTELKHYSHLQHLYFTQEMHFMKVTSNFSVNKHPSSFIKLKKNVLQLFLFVFLMFSACCTEVIGLKSVKQGKQI